MNRIVVDKDINNINKNSNYLIKDHRKKYIFNVNNSVVNILSVKENQDDEKYEININGGKLILNNICYNQKNLDIKVNLNTEESEVLIYNSIVTDIKKEVRIRINHNKKNTISNVYNNGVTRGNGFIKFDVISYVPNGVKGCFVNQDSKIISLNDKNSNEINPVLLIEEYDVEARHAAFIGKFNEQELFYLMSRGLNKVEAENLLLNGMLVGTLDICFEEKENLKKKFNDEWR